MWKEILKICAKLTALILPFFIVLPLYCRFFPFCYLDEEYAMYRQQYDYVRGTLQSGKINPQTADSQITGTQTTGSQTIGVQTTGTQSADPQILIIGDSRAKAAFDPALLSDDEHKVYNLSLGGTTPIEGYYTLQEYLKHHEKPQSVVLCYAPMHIMDVDTLWTRCIYFHTFDKEAFASLTQEAEAYRDTENILIEHYQTEYLMYRLWLPNKYASALRKSAFVGRYQKTTEKYAVMTEQRGHTFYGTADYSDGVDGEAKVEDFEASDIISAYLQKTIDLCAENGITPIVEQAPVNETSYSIIRPAFKEHYRACMEKFADRNEALEDFIYTDFYCYPNDCFGDADHLNERGVQAFCGQMREKYGW